MRTDRCPSCSRAKRRGGGGKTSTNGVKGDVSDVIDTLILGGLRVSELCGLDGPHLDIAAGRLRGPRSATKSDAGERNVPIVPALRQGPERAPDGLPERPARAGVP